jgi:hypothetical protein
MGSARIWHPELKRCAEVASASVPRWQDSGWLPADGLDLVETTQRRAPVRTFELRSALDTPAEEADNETPTSKED